MRFLLVEDRGDYTTNYSRKFADKDHQATVQNLNKTFDNSNSEEQTDKVEQDNLSGLSKIKTQLEKEKGKKYQNMQGAERNDFILDVIKRAPNNNVLSKANLGVINSIKNSNWDKNVIKYLDNLSSDLDISNPEVELISNLLVDGKINYNKSQHWLQNRSLYDRNEEDALYTIKALTFADNPNLKVDSKGNNRLTKDLTSRNFTDKGKIFNADRIKDILDSQSNPEAESTSTKTREGSTTRGEIKKTLSDNNIKKTDSEIDTIIDNSEEIVKNDLISALMNFGLKKADARRLVQDNYTNEKTFEELLRDMLRGLGRGA